MSAPAGRRSVEVTPEEQAWLDVYRDNVVIAVGVAQKWSGQIAVNIHEGQFINADVRFHLRLKVRKTA